MTITEGIYKLTDAHRALRPDRRKAFDWRAADTDKGTLFAVTPVEVYHRAGSTAVGTLITVLEISRLDGYMYGFVRVDVLPTTFTTLLERIEVPTPTQYLQYRRHSSLAGAILDELVASSKLTLDDIKQAEQAVIYHE